MKDTQDTRVHFGGIKLLRQDAYDSVDRPKSEYDYWYKLIPEKPAADFCNLTPRALQAYRQRGGGPRHIRLSSRCIRYRRIDLQDWAEARLRITTSEDDRRC